MKKNIFLIVLLCGIISNAQTIVINDKLLTQMTKNHSVRMASEETFLNSYEKQRKLYEDINGKIAQAIVIHEHIYRQLRNVNAALLQSKKLIYIYQYLERIKKNGSVMLSATTRRPQYAILVSKYYNNILIETQKLFTELTAEILNENNDFLMDSMDREYLIENIYMRLRHINGNILLITWRLQSANEIPYLYQVPILRDYISLDKLIVDDIIRKYNYIFN
ncbi:hypothetical protein [Vaginella massiliensis]|uniref:hypothetical protein n=1 Tax=Vaginella massiliensis TaxID=1816680 RepID=UPI000837AF84|nr:hypothetical protein [Vaginella massiliensis]